MEDFKIEDIKKIRALIYKYGKEDNCVLEFEATYNDGNTKVIGVPFTEIDDEKAIAGRLDDLEIREQTTKLFLDCLKQNNLKAKDVEAYYTNDKKSVETYDKLTGVVYNDENKKSNAAKVLVGAGIVAGAIGLGALGMHVVDELNKEPVAVTTETDMNLEDEIIVEDTFSKPDMEGKDWNYYLENALNYDYSNVDQTNLEQVKDIRGLIDQKSFMQNIYAFVDYINDVAQPYFEGYLDENGEQVVFNITPEEAFAMSIRMNNFSTEELVNIFANTSIDIDNILNIDSNSLGKKMIAFYGMCPVESHIDAIFINPNEAQTIREFEAANITMLNAEDKEKEEAMNILHDMYFDYFRSDEKDKNGIVHDDEASWGSTDYILTTMLQSNTITSETLGYKGTVTLQRKGTEKYVEAKTGLFNDAFVRIYNATDNDANWEEDFVNGLNGYTADKYQIVDLAKKLSIAQSSCALQRPRLEAVADFTLRSDIQAAKNSTVKSDADLLSETSYEPQLILDMMKQELSKKYSFTSSPEDIFNAFLQKCMNDQDKIFGKSTGTAPTTTVTNIPDHIGKRYGSLGELYALGPNVTVNVVGAYSGPPMRDQVPDQIIEGEIGREEVEALKRENDAKTAQEAVARNEAEQKREQVKEEIIEKAEKDGVTGITTDSTGAIDNEWIKNIENTAPEAVIPNGVSSNISSPVAESPAPVVESPAPVVEAPTAEPESEPVVDGAVYFSDSQIEDMLNASLNSAPEEEPAKTM